MALSLQAANLVQQKVYTAINGRADSKNARVFWEAARSFFQQHVSNGNANLQFIPFSEADADTAEGTVLANAPCKVYLFYVKKLNVATANTVKLFDNAAGDSATGDQTLSIPLDAALQEAAQVYPGGFSHAAGVVVTQHTTIEGASDGSDGGDGFIVIGAA
jgi:hypothetical protein